MVLVPLIATLSKCWFYTVTKAEIRTCVLSKATGKPESDVNELFEHICAANPKIVRGLMVEVPEEQAERNMEAMLAEGPGILARLMRGAQEVAAFESRTVHRTGLRQAPPESWSAVPLREAPRR